MNAPRIDNVLNERASGYDMKESILLVYHRIVRLPTIEKGFLTVKPYIDITDDVKAVYSNRIVYHHYNLEVCHSIVVFVKGREAPQRGFIPLFMTTICQQTMWDKTYSLMVLPTFENSFRIPSNRSAFLIIFSSRLMADMEQYWTTLIIDPPVNS